MENSNVTVPGTPQKVDDLDDVDSKGHSSLDDFGEAGSNAPGLPSVPDGPSTSDSYARAKNRNGKKPLVIRFNQNDSGAFQDEIIIEGSSRDPKLDPSGENDELPVTNTDQMRRHPRPYIEGDDSNVYSIQSKLPSRPRNSSNRQGTRPHLYNPSARNPEDDVRVNTQAQNESDTDVQHKNGPDVGPGLYQQGPYYDYGDEIGPFDKDYYAFRRQPAGQTVPYYGPANPFTPGPDPPPQSFYGQDTYGEPQYVPPPFAAPPYRTHYDTGASYGYRPYPQPLQLGWHTPPVVNTGAVNAAELARIRHQLEKQKRQMENQNKELQEYRNAESKEHLVSRAKLHEQRKNEEAVAASQKRLEEERRRAEVTLLEERVKKAEREAEAKVKELNDSAREAQKAEEERQKRVYREIREQVEAEIHAQEQMKKAEDDARRRMKEDIRAELLAERRDHDEFLMREEMRKKDIERRVEREFEEKRRRETEMLQFKEATERRLRFEADKVIEGERRKYDLERLGLDVQRNTEKVIQETILRAAAMESGSTTPRVEDYQAGTPSSIEPELLRTLPNDWRLNTKLQPAQNHVESVRNDQRDSRFTGAWDMRSLDSVPAHTSQHNGRLHSALGFSSSSWHGPPKVSANVHANPFLPRQIPIGHSEFEGWRCPQPSPSLKMPIPTSHASRAQVLRSFGPQISQSDTLSSNIIISPEPLEGRTEVDINLTEMQTPPASNDQLSRSSSDRVRSASNSRFSTTFHTPTDKRATPQNIGRPRATPPTVDVGGSNRNTSDHSKIIMTQSISTDRSVFLDNRIRQDDHAGTSKAAMENRETRPALQKDRWGYQVRKAYNDDSEISPVYQPETPPIHADMPQEVREQLQMFEAMAETSVSQDHRSIEELKKLPITRPQSLTHPNRQGVQSEGAESLKNLKRRKCFTIERRAT